MAMAGDAASPRPRAVEEPLFSFANATDDDTSDDNGGVGRRERLQMLRLPPTADFHVHLRDGAMMEMVVPTIRQGGVDLVYVMPNLTPPITTVQQALAYRARLQALEPRVTFLMTLYLHPSVTPATIREAKAAAGGGVIVGVKVYPHGVTTNSASGVDASSRGSYVAYHPVFAEMERLDMVLNLHGECPSSSSMPSASKRQRSHNRSGSPSNGKGDDDGVGDITVLNAEHAFLPVLVDLHRRFPRLRIVLEHCTTAAAVQTVQRCGPTVAGTITAHHLFLTVDDWADDPFCFCKPVAKSPSDRAALLNAVVSSSIAPVPASTSTASASINQDTPAAAASPVEASASSEENRRERVRVAGTSSVAGGSSGDGALSSSSSSSSSTCKVHDAPEISRAPPQLLPHRKFFFGSDSAPHPVLAKRGGPSGRAKTAAGIFTQPFATQLVLDALEDGVRAGVVPASRVTRAAVVAFLSRTGRAFYQQPAVADDGDFVVEVRREGNGTDEEAGGGGGGVGGSSSSADDDTGARRGEGDEGGVTIPPVLRSQDGALEVAHFRAGRRTWRLKWT